MDTKLVVTGSGVVHGARGDTCGGGVGDRVTIADPQVVQSGARRQRADLGHTAPCRIIEGQKELDGQVYLTTPEAAAYLRKSVSWLLRQHDVPFLSGNPNIYRRTDLDDWFERSKVRPRAN
jgi:hypothetical protein